MQILLYEIEMKTPERTILSLKMKKLFAFNVKYIFVDYTFKYKISPRKSQRKAYTCTKETLKLCAPRMAQGLTSASPHTIYY